MIIKIRVVGSQDVSGDLGAEILENETAVVTFESLKVDQLRATDIGTISVQGAAVRNLGFLPSLILSGSASPPASPRMWEQELTLHGYPLANLSPFLIKSVGKRLIGGKLELLSKMTLEGDQIDMENTLELKEIEMKTVNEKTSENTWWNTSPSKKNNCKPSSRVLFTIPELNRR